jgi:hypothetical protein
MTVTAVAALMASGCGGAISEPPPTSKTQSGGNFYPAYLEMLKGHMPQDNCSNPRDLAEMMLSPCDK